ncbi:FRG domain-containing protein [Ochrobactrum teleogrylli]|uniref:FRG domain-containing protein n=1 Tax=Ochrobactrum teleogrylli TaxID=2479765 RepID=A0ABY2Y3Q8_9HYPH|nr:FRG domain-containing protein [[Ochrobactrum] teleogrylli]TNV15934.1 FRG domain-containing protein [[Ochrobactrum] teleogrylli]
MLLTDGSKEKHERVTAKNWSHLMDLLHEDTFDVGIQRHRSTYAYRGMSSSNWEAVTSLSRLGKPYDGMELNIVKQFEKYAGEVIRLDGNPWRTLSIGQHYGLPTRLLDWSYSPQVALHFATSSLENYDDDGVIWKANFKDVHSLLKDEHKKFLRETGSSVFTFESLANAFPTLEKFAEQTVNTPISKTPLAIFFEPPSIDGRITNQFAYFSALSDDTMKMTDWLLSGDIPKVVRSRMIIIPKDLKWEVRDKLDQSNINERLLFPGVEGLCSWLRRHYKPR